MAKIKSSSQVRRDSYSNERVAEAGQAQPLCEHALKPGPETTSPMPEITLGDTYAQINHS